MTDYLRIFRNNKIAGNIIKKIKKSVSQDSIKLMEVCGTHTVSIFRYGINDLLKPNIRLLSGPGCPVCVTPNDYLDRAISYSRLKDVIIASFGDMIRVPGSVSSLEKQKAAGADARVVYSVLEAVSIARENLSKKVIFLGVGFETTSPSIAVSILEAKKLGLKNFFVLCGHKVIIPALGALLKNKQLDIDGLILPGHVSSIIGSKIYEPMAKKYKIPSVITGFEPLDILEGIYMLVKQIKDKKPKVQIQYTRIVKPKGNLRAIKILRKVFRITDSNWRGIGKIPKSGLKIKKEYSVFDAEAHFKIKLNKAKEHPGCICADVLCAIKTPLDCKLFRKACTPLNPCGACMVSSEGACGAYYKYAD